MMRLFAASTSSCRWIEHVLRIPKLLCPSKTGRNCLRKLGRKAADSVVTVATGAVTTKARDDATGQAGGTGNLRTAYYLLGELAYIF